MLVVFGLRHLKDFKCGAGRSMGRGRAAWRSSCDGKVLKGRNIAATSQKKNYRSVLEAICNGRKASLYSCLMAAREMSLNLPEAITPLLGAAAAPITC